MFQDQLARRLDQHFHHGPLRRRQHDMLDELLVLNPTAVPADQLHPRARQGDVEDAGVGGVGQPQPHDLARREGKTQVGVAGDQQPVAEAAHGRVARLSGAEGGDLAILDQNVVQSQD